MIKNKVVLVPFPFNDLSTSKVRPALCLTDPIGPHRHVILAFITSRVLASLLATDLVIDPTRHAVPKNAVPGQRTASNTVRSDIAFGVIFAPQ